MYTKYFTPERVTNLKSHQIFVFGSNTAGKHGKGAALDAVRKFGAINGVGDGIQGQSYGISTKDKNLQVLSLEQIERKVKTFIKYAIKHYNRDFLVTPIGTGLAGYKAKDIAPMFKECLEMHNVILPESFVKELEK